jgi:hypothetical protein
MGERMAMSACRRQIVHVLGLGLLMLPFPHTEAQVFSPQEDHIMRKRMLEAERRVGSADNYT